MLTALLSSIEHSALTLWLRSSLAYPLLETAHLLGLASFFGSLLVVELLLLGRIRSNETASLAQQILPFTLLAFALVLLSGGLMFLTRPGELIHNPYFLAKLVLITLAGINAAWLHGRHGLQRRDALTRGQAGVSILIWSGVIFCGRWIAYF